MVPFLMKARPGWFVQQLIIGGLNQPPRLRPLWTLRGILLMAQPPLLGQGGEFGAPQRRRNDGPAGSVVYPDWFIGNGDARYTTNEGDRPGAARVHRAAARRGGRDMR